MNPASPQPPAPPPTFLQALRFWLKLGVISFGGPAGQIAIMHRELVATKRWISESHFLNALNFCMMLPGPEAQQLATYLGWRMHGVRGGIAAGALFVIPSMGILFGLSWVFITGGDTPWIAAIFHGLLAAVMAIVAEAVIRIGSKSLKTWSLRIVAMMAFIGIFGFGMSFVIILLLAAMIGWLGHRWIPNQFPSSGGTANSGLGADLVAAQLPAVPEASWTRSAKILIIGLILWWAPVFSLATWLGWASTPVQQGVFFSKAAMVTFGGAYAVLPYVAQQAVENHGWLTHAQMMTGLAFAETTPGPLIMVLQFVGFLGGWQHPGGLDPLMAATIGSLITTWVTFVPCFIFVFLAGPLIEKLGNIPRFSAVLMAITAAVVGVILNLGVQFALHALWPNDGSLDGFIAILALCAFLALRRFQVGLIPTIITCGVAGWIWWKVAG